MIYFALFCLIGIALLIVAGVCRHVLVKSTDSDDVKKWMVGISDIFRLFAYIHFIEAFFQFLK